MKVKSPLQFPTLVLAAVLLAPSAAFAEEALSPGHLERKFRALDANENNAIDRDEIQISGERFRQVDTNQDGALSRAEVFAAYEKRMEKARQKRRDQRQKPERGEQPLAFQTASSHPLSASSSPALTSRAVAVS
jgi:hypothetical protein